MKKLFLLLTVLVASLSAFAEDTQPKDIKLTDTELQFVRNNSDFAFKLFRKYSEAQISETNGQAQESAAKSGSFVVSPLSITYALGMMNNGAMGETQQQINEVLGGTAGSPEVINSFCRKLIDAVNTLDKKTKVQIADNIYVNEASGYHLLPDFVQSAADYYDATPETRNFYDGKTREVINQWASDHTEGLIKEPLKEDEFDPTAISYLLNALYFKSEWRTPFDMMPTQKKYFDGEKATADMMFQYGTYQYAKSEVCQSIELPYGNGAFLMTVFLPNKGKSIDDVIGLMGYCEGNDEQGNWNPMTYEPYRVYLELPRFETDTDQRLEQIMASLGMPRAFDSNEAQFDKFAVNEQQPDLPIYIDFMKQVAKIKVNESGTEAAAVTIIGGKYGGEPDLKYAEFIADHPFLYTISERSTGTILFMGQYTGEPLKNVRKDITLTEEEKQLVESNNDFAFRLFQKARGDESSIMSPLSITYALGMMNNGAAGQTQQEINDVLGFGQAGAEGINNFCRKLLTEAPVLDEETKAEIANTIYVNSGKGYELQQGFVDKANEYYDAQPEARNFYDGETWQVINQWANDHTNGMIPKVFNTEESFNEDAASYLLNAIYFKGAWANKFDKTFTRDEAFNGGETVPMMHQEENFVYSENDLYQAVRLPYGNGAYEMTVFLPREGKTIGDVVSKMNGKNWRDKYANSSLVDLKLPRLKTETSLRLVNIMSELGMPTAFTPEAEFPYFGNRDVFIGNMFQKAAIDLDEEGTEAAAVTIIEVAENAIPDEIVFHANRPFFYIISEQSTGAIFFMGQYVGEGTTTKPCDTNGDGTVDVADIAFIIDAMASNGQQDGTDVNGDGAVDVADISAVISAMAASTR